ncbi:MAG: TIGR00730 family Rossman fold protein [Verrucomicrobia bacterium]|nr:TIGR00730 family Rossman fold protein [Verrucomicrobiota bacterium]
MQDFTAGGIQGLQTTYSSSGNEEFDRRIRELVQEWGVRESPELITEMIVTALKMGSDVVPASDLKMINRSLKELRVAAKVFSPYQTKRKVAVFGSARTAAIEPDYIAAEKFAALMRDRGFMIVTGGGDGIMGAAQRGAGRKDSFGLNIRLPFEQRANEIIHGDPKLVNFNYFFTRKLNFIKETHAVALFPGGFGTMDECFECLTLMQTGKARIIPMVFVDKPGGIYWKTWTDFLHDHLLGRGLVSADDFHLFRMTDDVAEAAEEICRFYRHFNSYRWVGNQLVFRLTAELTDASVRQINKEFADLLETGPLHKTKPLKAESNEPELKDYPRLVGGVHRRNFGRLRLLIDALNSADTA